MLKRFLLFLIISCFTNFSYAQSGKLKFEKLGNKQGLSQSTVNFITQDSTGFMWFATKDGLNKYDGYTFQVYKKSLNNKNSLSTNDIKVLNPDNKNRLWIGSASGRLDILDISKQHFNSNLYPGIKNIQCIYQDKKGTTWIGTERQGLYRIQKNEIKRFTYNPQTQRSVSSNDISSNDISYITEDSRGRVWVGTANAGINIIDAKTNKIINYTDGAEHSLTDDFIKFIFEDQRKNMWVGTYGGGLKLFDEKTKEFISFKEAHSTFNLLIPQNRILSMEEGKNGHLWIGTENGGLYVYDPIKNQTDHYRHIDNDDSSISSNTISAIKRDRAGNMWLGTSNEGVCLVRVDAGRFKHFYSNPPNNSLSNNIVNFFFEDSKKNIWIGTDGGGLDRFNEKTEDFDVFNYVPNRSNQISGNYILSMAEDKDGNIWIGTWGNGLSILDKEGSFHILKNDPADPSSLSSDYTFYIMRDSKDRMWVGTYGGGLNLYNAKNKTFTHFVYEEDNPSSMSSNHILSLTEDKKGNLWIGTDGEGLNRFDDKTQQFETIRHSGEDTNSISHDRVVSVYEDTNGFLWLATNFGLNKYNPVTGENRRYFTDDGLANDVISSVIGDEKGFIWVATNKGISRINPENNEIRNYTTSDGLQEKEFRYGKLLSSSGKIYFGGKNGFNSFYPERIKDHDFQAPVVFTNFQIFNKDVPVAANEDDKSPLKRNISSVKEIVIPYSSSVFSFEFALLNYASTEENNYAYQLSGFDENWHELGRKNNVTFTNLDPGTYQLKVRAVNKNGKWSDKISEIQIAVTPPFWKTLWFIALELLLVAAIIIGIFYFRVSSIKRRNRQLKEEVSSRTQELSETNSFLLESNEKIQIQNFSLEDSNQEIQRKTDKILDQQKRIIVQNQQLESNIKELETSNKTKDELFSIVAHDLKNPVTALCGTIDLLHKNIATLSKDEIHAHINNIRSSSESVNSLIVNLLDWTRTQSRNIAYNPTEINVHELLMKNIFLIEMQLNNKNISCHMNVDMSHHIWGDKYMVDTIVRNILSNAIKYTGLNGDITITSTSSKDKLVIDFKDTGVGMSEQQIEEIYVHQNKSISYGTLGEAGTRLGLHLVKEFIDINKGALQIKSQEKVGSIFRIVLPKAKSDALVGNSSYEHKTERLFLKNEDTHLLKGKRILIVDDNPEVRNFLKLILSGLIETFEAADGKEGLQVAKEAQPDIIITDLIMPVLNGVEFCRQLKSNHNTSHIPVILLTYNTGEKAQLSAYEAGADSFLNKPINQALLFSALLNLIVNQEKVIKKFAISDDLLQIEGNYNKLDEEFLANVSQYVEQHLADANLDHRKLCKLTAMSRTMLYAKFKTLTGMGVHDFIKNIRLKKARQLLQKGTLNISQIAYEVGFATPSYFSKSFAKRYHMNPSDYIAKIKNRSNELTEKSRST